jgi:hypothetical protein
MRYMYRVVFVHALAVLLAGCAATPPTQYAQGVPVAPRAPSFSPALDAPITVGQPGYVGPAENLPRSPHGRVLPQTPATQREPGLWAGDQPRAVATEPPDWRTREPRVLGIAIPEKEGMGPDDIVILKRCAAATDSALTAVLAPAAISGLTPVERQCLAQIAHGNCVDLERLRHFKARTGKDKGRMDIVTKALFARLDMEMSELATRTCPRGGFTDAVAKAARMADMELPNHTWWTR